MRDGPGIEHPYARAGDRAFWSKAVARNYDPASVFTGSPCLVRKGQKVMTAGSCFAANLIPALEQSGFTYLRTELRHPSFATAPAENFGYETFSAAYGNIYTARQLLQLLRRSLGTFSPRESRWHASGRVIDPYRPGLRYAAMSDREFDLVTEQHLRATRTAFEQADVFIFTLGLTEAWVSRADGAVFPACPGTIAGNFDPERHQFVNFTCADIVADLVAFLSELRSVNSRINVILTVSPVPLVATATNQHVLAATIHSKSTLRAAAGEILTRQSGVAYFPAYEIVTGPQAPHGYFEPDRRNVSARGVAAVMSAFLAHCEQDPTAKSGTRPFKERLSSLLNALSQRWGRLEPARPMPARRASDAEKQKIALARKKIDAECEEAMLDRN
jgi:hypothetical protein